MPVEQWSNLLVEVPDYGWFKDKLCSCKKFKPGITPDPDTWKKPYKKPFTCRDCNGWDRSPMLKCCRCNEWYYQFFRHPRMGFHLTPRKGWYCWNCLVEAYPPTVQSYTATLPIIPPPLEVLPPGYELLIEEE